MLAKVLDVAGDETRDFDADETCLEMAASRRREDMDVSMAKQQR